MMCRWMVPVVLFLADAPLAGGQTATFKSDVEAIRVDVLVSQNGHPIRDLRPQDFDVFDNGVRQRVDYATFEQIPLNVVLVLDTSESVTGEPLQHLRASSRALLGGLRPEDQAALVTFGHAVVLRSRLVRNHAALGRALEETRAEGATALVDASFVGLVVGESDVGRALLIVFSDGLDVTSWLAPDAVLDNARRSDVVVYGVAVRSPAKPEFLQSLADATGGDLLEIESTKNLEATFLGILDEFRNRYLIGYSPQGVQRGGWHRVEVKVKRRGARVKARPGYSGKLASGH